MKAPVLKLTSLEFEAYAIMINASAEYYMAQQNTDVTLVGHNLLRLNVINQLLHEILKITHHKHYQNFTHITIKFTCYQAAYFVSSIVPASNLGFHEKVKQILEAYCNQVLKQAGIIPNLPTYQLKKSGNAWENPKAFMNKSTTINDFIYEG